MLPQAKESRISATAERLNHVIDKKSHNY